MLDDIVGVHFAISKGDADIHSSVCQSGSWNTLNMCNGMYEALMKHENTMRDLDQVTRMFHRRSEPSEDAYCGHVVSRQAVQRLGKSVKLQSLRMLRHNIYRAWLCLQVRRTSKTCFVRGVFNQTNGYLLRYTIR
jgi:hypothetical protein